MFNDISIILTVFSLFALVFTSIKIVPQQQAWIVERLGKFNEILQPGITIIIPIIDKIAYKHTLKERAIGVTQQAAITKDNVSLTLDGVLYVKVTNPKDASYGVEEPYYAVTQLAQTSMRSAIGKLEMDKTFEERETLNIEIVQAINEAAGTWGIQCMRYEIKDINPPNTIIKAMEAQVSSERKKRAQILESEGKMSSMINVAEGEKRSVILKSEAGMRDKINKAKGEYEAILLIASATATGIENIANSMQKNGGYDAVTMKIAQEYIYAFQKLAKESNTIIVPSEVNNIGSMVSQAISIFDSIKKK